MRIVDGGDGLDGLLTAFDDNGYRVAVLHLISSEVGSAQSVARWLELAGDRVDHVAIRNTRWGKSPADFPFWHGFTDGRGIAKGGKTREKLMAMGGVEIDLPSLPAGTFAKVDADNLAFSAAINEPSLTITERHMSRSTIASSPSPSSRCAACWVCDAMILGGGRGPSSTLSCSSAECHASREQATVR